MPKHRTGRGVGAHADTLPLSLDVTCRRAWGCECGLFDSACSLCDLTGLGNKCVTCKQILQQKEGLPLPVPRALCKCLPAK